MMIIWQSECVLGLRKLCFCSMHSAMLRYDDPLTIGMWFRSAILIERYRYVSMSIIPQNVPISIGNISRISKYIPQDSSVVLFNSLLMARMDYSNGLYYRLPKCTGSVFKTQLHIFNTGEAARSWFYVTYLDGVALVVSWQEDWVLAAAIYV